MRALRLGLATSGLLWSGCLTHMVAERTEYLGIQWAGDLAAAEVTAASQDKPLLLVFAAGDLTGPCCVGADALRTGALSDPAVIAMVNEGFIPVWINVRRELIPDLPGIDGVLTDAILDRHRHVVDPLSSSFFVRSAVYTPDGRTLLNPAATNVLTSIGTFLEEGHFAFAELTPKAYARMLKKSLARRGALQDAVQSRR